MLPVDASTLISFVNQQSKGEAVDGSAVEGFGVGLEKENAGQDVRLVHISRAKISGFIR